MTEPRRRLDHAGCTLDYVLRGEGPPVLLIQGVGLHGDGWLPQVDALARGYRCLTFDNRGMGRSQPVASKLTVDQMADDARALLDAVGSDRAHVVGHSLGGLVALRLAQLHRTRVRSLSLLCTFASGKAAAPLTWRMMSLGLRTRVGTRRMRRHAFLRLVMPPGPVIRTDLDALAERLAPLFGHDLADQPPVVASQLAAMTACDATPGLAALAGLPTLVVSAVHDPIAPPAAGRAIAAGIPGSRYVELADASHGAPIESAARVNELLLAHLGSA